MVPTVASPAAANPAAVTGTSTAGLGVLGADASDSSGEACLSYTWSVTALPAGAASPVFSVNGTNAAKTTTATFASAGHYSFLVMIGDPQGLSVGTSVNVTVGQSFEAVDVTPGRTELGPGQTRQFTAEAEVQFRRCSEPPAGVHMVGTRRHDLDPRAIHGPGRVRRRQADCILGISCRDGDRECHAGHPG